MKGITLKISIAEKLCYKKSKRTTKSNLVYHM